MSRFTFNFYLDIRKPLKSGLYSIKVNLYDGKEKRTTNFTIKKVDGIEVSCSKSDWNDIWLNRHKKNNFGEITGEKTVYGHKMTIRTILKAKEDILIDIIGTEGVFSSGAIKDKFNQYKLPTSFTDDVYTEFSKKIDLLEKAERYKSRDTYANTLKNIKKHNHDRAFRFSDITVFWLNEYERIKSRKGLAKASIALDMRNIRSIYNTVKKKDAYLIENYPFGLAKDGLYTIKEGKAKNQGLELVDIEKLRAFSSNVNTLQLARDVFLFSFYFGGMNWKDLILLTPQNIEDQFFVRKKTEFTTKEEVKIPIEINKIQREIVSRYRGKGKYLFNFLPDNATEKQIYKEQKLGISRLDKSLKKLANKLGLNPKLSYQWSRHTFATLLHQDPNVSPKAISEAMGHVNLNTTTGYFDTLYSKEKGKINRALGVEDE